MPLRIAFIGGGSGGHLLPAIAIAEELRCTDHGSQFLFLTSHRKIDQKILAASGVNDSNSRTMPYTAFSSSRGPFSKIAQLPSVWRSFRLARNELKVFQPDVVVGLGAFASVPGILAASRLGFPVVLLEQNCLPGKATRMLASRARLTVFGLPIAEERIRNWPSPTKTCGTPVRAGIRSLAKLPVNRDLVRNRILILGGSQGSESVNAIVTNAVCMGKLVPQDWEIVHQTGDAQVATIQAQYLRHGIIARVAAFLPDMQAELAAASIVVSRAGAVTIQELACAGVPSILIPLSTSAENHQMLNARMMEHIGAAIVVDEKNRMDGNAFKAALERLLRNPAHRQQMAHAARSMGTPDAAFEVAGILIDVAGQTAGSSMP